MANGYEATGTGIEGLLPGTSSGKDIPSEAEVMQNYYASMGRSTSGATGDDYLSTIGGVSPETIAKHSNPEDIDNYIGTREEIIELLTPATMEEITVTGKPPFGYRTLGLCDEVIHEFKHITDK